MINLLMTSSFLASYPAKLGCYLCHINHGHVPFIMCRTTYYETPNSYYQLELEMFVVIIFCNLYVRKIGICGFNGCG